MHSVGAVFLETERVQGSHGGEVEDTSAAALSCLDSVECSSAQTFVRALPDICFTWLLPGIIWLK